MNRRLPRAMALAATASLGCLGDDGAHAVFDQVAIRTGKNSALGES